MDRDASPGGPSQYSTNTRSSPSRVSRPARPGARTAASSSGTNRPDGSSRPSLTSPVTASTSPEPHSPAGSASPMTVSSQVSGVIVTTSMAPSAARIPQRIAAPSKAGPAGAAVASSQSRLPSTISQLVPMSMNNRVRASLSMPEASRPAVMSPPTYAPNGGNTTALARGCTATPRSAASTSGNSRAARMNGATPSGSG